jgi:hypothetical protein
MSDLYQLRYIEGAHHGRFGSIRYPARHGVSREQAELMRQAMPNPELFEIVKEGD